MRETVEVEVDGNRLEISNLDKVLWPKTGFTKAQMIDYYARVAPFMLPHLKGRPVTLKRYPDGVEAESFYEKECPRGHPGWVGTATVSSRNKRGRVNYCVVENAATLVWLANLAAIEFHVLLAEARQPGRPTAIVFDLDPGPPAGVLDAAWAARRLREVLEEDGLQAFPKVSGGKGVHVYVPLNAGASFDRTKAYARAVALVLERRYPERVTSVMRKEAREGKIFVDWSQNDPRKTTACVYSLRARSEPFVSTPVEWAELEEASAGSSPGPLSFEPWEALSRAGEKGDLFKPVLELKQELPARA